MNRIEEKIDRMSDDTRNIQVRMTHLEEGVTAVNRRLDGFDLRLDRVERRLDLTAASLMESGEMFKGPER